MLLSLFYHPSFSLQACSSTFETRLASAASNQSLKRRAPHSTSLLSSDRPLTCPALSAPSGTGRYVTAGNGRLVTAGCHSSYSTVRHGRERTTCHGRGQDDMSRQDVTAYTWRVHGSERTVRHGRKRTTCLAVRKSQQRYDGGTATTGRYVSVEAGQFRSRHVQDGT